MTVTMTKTYRPPTSLCPALLAGLRGTVLELGPGAGANLVHYHEDVRWIGVEPKAANRDRTRRAAARLGRPDVRVLAGRAERLDLPDRSVDAVAATFVLCSVGDLDAALSEIVRVLRPGGRYVFAEHVAAPAGTALRRVQNGYAAVTRLFGAGCRPDRETLPAVERAGLEVLDLHRYPVTGPFGAGIPHIAGAARRPTIEKGRIP
jgi:ubiquinone/menaquinone biosynthesis C-methylase UbiE